jgi:hypothetical protein
MNASDKYRKYLICIKFSDVKFFAIWGTDLEDNEQDKLVLSKNGKIICSKDYMRLKEYLLVNTDLLFDVNNLIFWLLSNEDFEPSATYDLDKVGNFIKEFADISYIDNKNMMIGVVDFINMALDYSSQVGNNCIIEVLNKKSMLTYKDFVYNEFLWKKSSDQIDLKIIEALDKKQLCMDMQKVLNFIINNFVEL